MTGRHRSAYRRVERKVYLADRTSLDVAAALRGPAPLARRLVRRSVTRSLFRLLR
jgi:hypothetical protein